MAIFAYIDPGSGTMILQVLLAGALAIPFFFRRAISGAWQRIRGGRDDTSSVERRDSERPDR